MHDVRSMGTGLVRAAVAFGHLSRRQDCGSRRSYGNADKRECKDQMSQGAKQPHAPIANDGSGSPQLSAV